MSGVCCSTSVSVSSAFCDLLRGALDRRVVGDRGRHDDDVACRRRAPSRPRASRRRCAPARPRATAGGSIARRPGDERHVGAAPRRLGGDRESHAPARPVADEAHRIDVFVGRPGGDQDAPAAQRTVAARSMASAAATISSGSARRPFADPAAGQIALARLDEPHAARGQRIEIPPHGLVREHLRVHRRRHQHRRPRRRVQRRQEIVGDAVGELADDVRGGRRDRAADRSSTRARCARCRRWRRARTDR